MKDAALRRLPLLPRVHPKNHAASDRYRTDRSCSVWLLPSDFSWPYEGRLGLIEHGAPVSRLVTRFAGPDSASLGQILTLSSLYWLSSLV